MSSLIAWGSVFPVNSTIKGEQIDPKAQTFKDGSFVTVWEDRSATGGDTSGASIRGQLFNADGSRKGGEFLINTVTAGTQSSPEIAMLNDGRFVVTWVDVTAGYIKARAYQANGSAIGNEFTVSSTGDDLNAAITALSNGGFAVSYYDASGKTRVQNFGADLQKSGSETVVDMGIAIPRLVGLQGKSILLAEDDTKISGIIVNNDGTVPAGSVPFDISTGGSYNYGAVAAKLADGRVIVAWKSGVEDPNGGPDLILIKGQILNADGSKSGGELLLSAPGYTTHGSIAAAALPDGGFSVIYLDDVTGRNRDDLHVAIFGSNGARISDDVLPEHVYGGSRTDISVLADGRMLVSWTNMVSPWDDFGSGIHAQIVDLRQKAVSLAGTASDDRYYGSKFNDSIKGEAGNDVLFGREGSDTLTGGAGSDAFVFDTAPVVGKAKHIDRIMDFDGRADKIYLDDAVFKGLSKKANSLNAPVKIDKQAFWKGGAAHDKNDRIIVKTTTGEVLYDADGTGKAKAVMIAKLDKNALKFVDAGDFFVI